VLKHIIHDWEDAKAAAILRNIHRAARPSAKVILLECILAPGNDPGFIKWLDLEMLLLPGGRERTEEEYRSLLANAGFKLTRVVPTKSPVCVIEAVREN
jgi:O-methyltransferase domain